MAVSVRHDEGRGICEREAVMRRMVPLFEEGERREEQLMVPVIV